MAGYSNTPLQRKLGIKPGMRLLVLDAPESYLHWLGNLPENISFSSESDTDRDAEVFDFIHFFCEDPDRLQTQLPSLKMKLRKNGMLWISWIKKSSTKKSQLDGNQVREAGLMNGLVDIKVCAVSEDWSGLKFMYRKEDR